MENENPSLEGNLEQSQDIKCSACGQPIDKDNYYDHSLCQTFSPAEQAELSEIFAKRKFWLGIENIDPKFHRIIALKLIEARHGDDVIRNLEKFQGLDHREIALKLIDKSWGRDVIKNLEKFQGLDHREIALELIKVGSVRDVVYNLEKFQGVNHKELVMMSINYDWGGCIIKNLDKFQGLDMEVALGLFLLPVENKYEEDKNFRAIVRNLDKFQGVDYKEFAMKLIKRGYGYIIAFFPEKFHGIDHKELVEMLIGCSSGHFVAENLEKFHGIDHKELAMTLLNRRGSERFFKMWSAKRWAETGDLDTQREVRHVTMDRHTAESILNSGGFDVWAVVKNLEKFQGLDKEVALLLIDRWSIGFFVVAENLEKFEGLDREVILKIIDHLGGVVDHDPYTGGIITYIKGPFLLVVDNLDKFRGTNDKEISLRLLEKLVVLKKYSLIVENLDKFQGVNHKEIAIKLIETAGSNFVAKNIDKFSYLDKEIFFVLIEKECDELFAHYFIRNKSFDFDRELALEMIRKGKKTARYFASLIDFFEDLDHKEIAMELIKNGHGGLVAENIYQFDPLVHKEIALKLIENGQINDIKKFAYHLEEFKNLDLEEIRKKLIESGSGRYFTSPVNNPKLWGREDQWWW